MRFERNYYKPSAVCPKCGTGNPKPKYIPHNTAMWSLMFDLWLHSESHAEINKLFWGRDYKPAPPPKTEDHVIPDKVVNLCLCGHEWEEKPE